MDKRLLKSFENGQEFLKFQKLTKQIVNDDF